MNVELKPDFELNDEACKAATGKTLTDWLAAIEARPELHNKRRDAITWLYDEMGRGKDTWWSTTAWVEFQARKGVVQKDGRAEGYNICATKTIAAPLSSVYAAFTGADLNRWLGDGAVADADGSVSDSNGNKGTATRVRPDKDLRYKWQTAGVDGETEVDVAFAEKNGKTGITLTHNRIQTRAESDGLRRAWGEAFDRLKAMLESK